MYRIKYLIGIFSGIFGLLYIFFGIVGFEDARTFLDRYTAFMLAGVHTVVSAVVFASSYVDKKNQDKRVGEVIGALMLLHPVVSAQMIADETSLSVEDAQEYLDKHSAQFTKKQ